MGCDRAFGVIERLLKQHGSVMTPPEYCDVIKTSEVNQFEVTYMDQAKFLNFEVLQNKITKRKVSTKAFRNVKKILVKLQYREGYLLKPDYSHGDAYATKVRVMPGKSAFHIQTFDLSKVPLLTKYESSELRKNR